jgi:hypothetical protein
VEQVDSVLFADTSRNRTGETVSGCKKCSLHFGMCEDYWLVDCGRLWACLGRYLAAFLGQILFSSSRYPHLVYISEITSLTVISFLSTKLHGVV